MTKCNSSKLITEKTNEPTNENNLKSRPSQNSSDFKKDLKTNALSQNSLNPQKIKASQESLKNSLLLRANKIFINQNNCCMILDSEKLIEEMKAKIPSPQNSLLKSSSFLHKNSQTNTILMDNRKMDKVEKILTENYEENEKIKILSYKNIVERNEQWLLEKMRKKDMLKKEKEKNEMNDCSFHPTFFTKGFRSSSNSRISTVIKNEETSSAFSSHRSIMSNFNHCKRSDSQSCLQSAYDKLKIKGNNCKSKWYFHESYKKEYERKKDFSSQK